MRIETFVFIHDQNYVLDFILHKKFKEFENVKYVFVGNRDSSLLKHLDNVIIVKDLSINLEQYPQMTAFSGWYALWKNGYINKDTDYIHLFEYDINVLPNINDICKLFLSDYPDQLGYVTITVDDQCYLKKNIWIDVLIESIKNNYDLDFMDYVKNINPKQKVAVTSNHTFSNKCFHEYMKWIEPIIYDIKDNKYCGHQLERSISIFTFLFHKDVFYIENVLIHFQIDSHFTQDMHDSRINRYYPRILTQDSMTLR